MEMGRYANRVAVGATHRMLASPIPPGLLTYQPGKTEETNFLGVIADCSMHPT